MSKCRFLSHRAFSFLPQATSKTKAFVTTVVVGGLLSGGLLAATKTFDGGPAGTGTALDTAANWSPDGNPVTTDEALLDNSVLATLPSTLTLSAGNLTIGDVIWNSNNSSTIAINATGTTSRTLTLSGGGTAAVAAGGAAADLLVMGTAAISNTLVLGGNTGTGTGNLTISLGKAGNFDVVQAGATMDIKAVITGAQSLTKTGVGTLILEGNNNFAGSNLTFTISAGTVQMAGVGTLGSKATDLTVNANLDLNSTSQTVDAFAGTTAGKVYNNGTGTATLTTGFDFGGGTFSGVISDNTNSGAGIVALTKINSNTLTLAGTNTYSGATNVIAGYIGNAAGVGTGGLTLNSSVARVTNSDVTMYGTTLTLTDNAAGTAARAKSVTLNNAVMNLNGTSAGNSVDAIANALTLGGGRSTITVAPNGTKNIQLSAATLARANGATALVRGANLGVNSIASGTVNSGNIVFGTAPTILGANTPGSATMGIIPYLYGDNSNTGIGTDFMTYDATNGLRRLTASEYVTTFASGNSTLVNAKIATVINTISGATSLNSLTLGTNARVNGTGTLTISSGGILATDNASIGTLTAGTVDFGSAEGVLIAVAGKTLTIGSSITGSGGLTAGGAGTVVLTGNNSYTGGTFVSGGVLNINGDAALGTAPASATTNITMSGGTLQAGAANVALGSTRNIVTTTQAVNANFDTNGNAMSIAGVISGAGNINKIGAGTLTLSGNNTFTGTTFVSGGTLNVTGQLSATNSLTLVGGTAKLDFSAATAPQNNIVTNTAALNFNIGPVLTAGVNNLVIQGKDNTSNSQTFAATNFSNFASHLALTAGASGTLTVNLGAVTRNTPTTNASNTSNPAGATLDISMGTGVTVTASSATTNGGIITGATVNGTTWATLSAGNIVGLSSYSNSLTTASANVDVAGGGGTLTVDINSMRFNNNAAQTITLGGTNSIRDIASGVLVTSNVGNNLSLITGGILQGFGRRDIIFIQNNTAGALQVDSIITDLSGAGNQGITKSGLGTLILTGNNTVGGVAVINEGTIIVTGNAAAAVNKTGTINSGTLNQVTLTDLTGIFIGQKVVQTTGGSTGSGVLNNSGAVTWVVVAIDAGTNTVTLSSNAQGTIAGGTFNFSGAGGLGAGTGNHSIAAGATLQIGNGGTGGQLFAGQGISDNGSLIFDHGDAFTYGAVAGEVISGAGTVMQEGLGTLTLSGSNTYTGSTIVASGSTLIAGSTSAFGVNSAINVQGGGDLQLNGKALTVGSLTGTGTIENASATSIILTIGSDNTSTNFGGVLQDGVGGGTLSVTKTGTGNQTFSGNSTLTGNLVLNTGAVTIAGGFTAPIFVGAVGGSSAILNIQNGATLNANVVGLNTSIAGGSGSSGNGAIYQTGGSVVFNGQIVMGSNASSYGFYNMSGGTIADTGVLASQTNERFRIGGAANNAVGMFYQSGGTVTLSSNGPGLEIGGNGGGPVTGAVGVGYFTGGSFTVNNTNHIGFDGTTGAVRGEETIAGTAVVTVNNVTTLGSTAGDVGILNLDGGVFAVKQIVKGTSGKGYVNFNGGTLKVATGTTGTAATFFNGLTAVTIYSGGATIDTNGINTTIAQNLVAPTGNGVTTIPVVDGGVGYVGAPYVGISGTGIGATAVANMVDDGTGNGTFKIASITITNPGTGYTGTPTVTLTGGGGLGAVLGSVATATNVSGGLTKTGAGTLTLSGTNSYTGATNVNQGTLQAGSTTGFSSASAFVVASGATLQTAGRSNTIGSLAGLGTVENASATAATLTVGNDGTSTSFDGVIQDGTGAGTLGLTKTGAGTQTLSNTNTYTGVTNINGGTLSVTGSLGATTVNVNNGGTLAGTGAIGGGTSTVNVSAGGTIAPGVNGIGTLSLNPLILNSGALLSFDLGTLSDRIAVTGALTLDGSLIIVPGTGFGAGSYTLITYTGALTNNGLDIATPAFGHTYSIDTSTTGQVKLLVDQIVAQFWDGATTVGDGVVHGGSGTWDNFTSNWTTADGASNTSWQNGVAVFTGTVGTVQISEQVSVAGLQFGTTGYQIVDGGGGNIDLQSNATEIRVESGLTATIQVPLSGAGLAKTGLGTLILSGSNSYIGDTAVKQGTLVIGAVNTLPTGTRLFVAPIGQTNGAELDVNNDQTVNSVTMGSVSGTDVLTIAAGQTLTVNGNDGTITAVQGNSIRNAFRIGGNVSAGNVTTTAVISGAGTLNINSPSANFAMDNVINPDGAVIGNVVADMSGLAHFNANVANFRVGFGQRAQATLTLSNDSNITAGVFTVGDSNGLNSSTGLSTLVFGQSTVINANTINFGNSKGVGVGFFNSGLTNPTLKIRGVTGDDASTADLNIAILTTTAAVPGLSSLIFDAGTGRSGGILDAKFNNIVIAKGSLSGSTGVAQGLFEFDNGSVSAATIKLGVAVDGSTGTGTNTGTFNIKGGTLTTGTVTLGTVGTSTQKAVGVFNITGGAVTMTGDIIDAGGTSTLNLNGGSLDMGGHNIGSATQSVDTVTLASGTLQNVAEINNGGAVTKTTAGVLVLTGINTYTGATNVSAGTLQVGSGNLGQSGTGNITVNGSGAALAGTGNVRGSTTITSGVIRPGDAAGSGVGTLTILSNLTMNPAAASTTGEFTLLDHTTSDNITITGNLTLNGNSNFVVTFDSGYTPTQGDTWHLLDWAGALALNGFSTGTNFRTGNNSAANEGNLDLPDLGPLGQWSVSQLADGSGGGSLIISIANVPEPGRAMLLMVGLGSLALRRRRSRKTDASV